MSQAGMNNTSAGPTPPTVATTYTENTGTATPAANNLNILGSGSITTSGTGSTITAALTGLTNHAVLVGAGTATITKVGPSATTGQVFQSQGASADPAFSTATYPSTATGTGTILRADGTNWAASTATYPNTTTANQLLYSSANNTIAGLATANSGVLTTNSSGVPSIDTTNFQVLSTGVQMKGNNTNTAPPAGFIGEQIRGTGNAGVSSNTPTNQASISLTPGVWNLSCAAEFTFSGNYSNCEVAMNSNSASFTGAAFADNYLQDNRGGSATFTPISISDYRVTLSATTTYYLVVRANFTTGSCVIVGRISATRVG